MQEGLSTPEEDLEEKSHNSAPLYIIFVMIVTKASICRPPTKAFCVDDMYGTTTPDSKHHPGLVGCPPD